MNTKKQYDMMNGAERIPYTEVIKRVFDWAKVIHSTSQIRNIPFDNWGEDAQRKALHAVHVLRVTDDEGKTYKYYEARTYKYPPPLKRLLDLS